MRQFDGDSVARALARYVRDFVPGPAHGVVVIRQGADGEALLGVYGKPERRGRADVDLYEALLAHARVELIGQHVTPRGAAWAVVVQAGHLVRPLTHLLLDLLHRRVVGPGREGPHSGRKVADLRVREWCDWWHSLSG